jgi:uncharacterized protein YdhG (YjbR/CyaY superfamily)
MAKTDYQNIDQYHSAFPAETVARMQTIRELIHEIVPDVEETISYQIPCFKYKGYLIYYAAFSGHITLSNPFSAALLERFKDELKNYKVSKAAIQLPLKDELPLEFIRELIAFRKAENEAVTEKKKRK